MNRCATSVSVEKPSPALRFKGIFYLACYLVYGTYQVSYSKQNNEYIVLNTCIKVSINHRRKTCCGARSFPINSGVGVCACSMKQAKPPPFTYSLPVRISLCTPQVRALSYTACTVTCVSTAKTYTCDIPHKIITREANPCLRYARMIVVT